MDIRIPKAVIIGSTTCGKTYAIKELEKRGYLCVDSDKVINEQDPWWFATKLGWKDPTWKSAERRYEYSLVLNRFVRNTLSRANELVDKSCSCVGNQAVPEAVVIFTNLGEMAATWASWADSARFFHRLSTQEMATLHEKRGDKHITGSMHLKADSCRAAQQVERASLAALNVEFLLPGQFILDSVTKQPRCDLEHSTAVYNHVLREFTSDARGHRNTYDESKAIGLVERQLRRLASTKPSIPYFIATEER